MIKNVCTNGFILQVALTTRPHYIKTTKSLEPNEGFPSLQLVSGAKRHHFTPVCYLLVKWVDVMTSVFFAVVLSNCKMVQVWLLTYDPQLNLIHEAH